MAEPMGEPTEWDMILGDVPLFKAHPGAFADVRRLLASLSTEDEQYEAVQIVMGLLDDESARTICEDPETKAMLAGYFRMLSKSTVNVLVSQLSSDVIALLPRRKALKKLTSTQSSGSFTHADPVQQQPVVLPTVDTTHSTPVTQITPVPQSSPLPRSVPLSSPLPRTVPVAESVPLPRSAPVPQPVAPAPVPPPPPVAIPPTQMTEIPMEPRPEWEIILGQSVFFEQNPSVFREVRDVIYAQAEESRYNSMAALVALTDDGVEDTTEDILIAAPIVKLLSKPCQVTLASGLSPHLQYLLPFMDKVPIDSLPALLPATLSLMEENLTGKVKPETAAKLHQTYFALPEKVRSQVINSLPPEEKVLVSTFIESTEGLSTAEVENVVTKMQEPSAPGSAPPSYQDPGLMKGFYLAASKSQGRRLCRWVQTSPKSIRVLAFLNGVLLFASSFIAFFFDLFSGYFLVFLINGWIMLFSAVLIVLEIKLSFFETQILPFIAKQVPLLGTVFGRGVFMVFVGFLAMSLVLQATWQNFLLCGAGLFSALLGAALMFLSALASHEFFRLCQAIPTEEMWRQAFQSVDVDNSGELDMDEFNLLCDKLGSRLDSIYVESIFRDIDTDRSNTLSLSELLVFWSSNKITDEDTEVVKKSVVHVPTSGLKKANITISFLTILTGILSNVAVMHNKAEGAGESTIYVVLNMWMIAFGVVMFIVETPVGIFRDIRIWITDNVVQFLATIFGRSAFYFFMGTFALSLYQNDSMVLPLITGLLLIIMAGVNLYIGFQAKGPFRQLAQYVQLKDVETIFQMHDHDHDDVWSLDELKGFTAYFGLEVKPLYWELLVDDMDHDHSGMVSLHEFASWVQRYRGTADARQTTTELQEDDVYGYDAEPIAREMIIVQMVSAPVRRSARLMGISASSTAPEKTKKVAKTKKDKVVKTRAVKTSVPVELDAGKPHFKHGTLTKDFEQRIYAKGYKCVVGVDEAGRGPLAGPVVAAACYVPLDVTIEGIHDSKKLDETQREWLYEQITSNKAIKYAVHINSPERIDEINILQATLESMQKAVQELPVPCDYALIDGNRMPTLSMEGETVVKGDSRVYSIAAASVIAKVTRDRLMVEYDKQYPGYGLAQHKGYGTKAHMLAIHKNGASPIHRMTFAPLNQL